ncbi:MAG: Uma2 family endonuclease [Microscillaceae bacterium]|jgi:Uma2 family endonuclease|nr:Uma2 family endonuclease [Microscillaceae bacterium]
MEKVVEISQYELERGKPMPSKLHSIAQANLIVEMAKYRNKYRFLSELSLSLDNWDAVPDLCIYDKSVLNTFEDEVELTIPPICAIEILSPSQSLNDLVAKAKKYFEKGVRSCWIVIPVFKNIYVYADAENYTIFKANETLYDSKLEISIPLNEVFV